MEPESAPDITLAGLSGHRLDDHEPMLTILAAQQLSRGDLERLVGQGLEDQELLDSAGPALEVVFAVEGEPGPWVWRFTLNDEDLPDPGPELDEHLASELSWRLLEWRDTREQRRA